MKRTAEEVANQKNQIIEKREARIHELEAENEQLREAVKEAVDQIFLSSDGRTLDHHAHDDLIEAGKKLQNALNDTGNENGSDPQTGNPKRLLKAGRSLVDEEQVAVVEISGLAYPWSVLVEIAWRYNKYPGLKRQHERLREAVMMHRSHDRISGTDILRTAAEQVGSLALACDLRSMASDIDAALSGGGDNGE